MPFGKRNNERLSEFSRLIQGFAQNDLEKRMFMANMEKSRASRLAVRKTLSDYANNMPKETTVEKTIFNTEQPTGIQGAMNLNPETGEQYWNKETRTETIPPDERAFAQNKISTLSKLIGIGTEEAKLAAKYISEDKLPKREDGYKSLKQKLDMQLALSKDARENRKADAYVKDKNEPKATKSEKPDNSWRTTKNATDKEINKLRKEYRENNEAISALTAERDKIAKMTDEERDKYAQAYAEQNKTSLPDLDNIIAGKERAQVEIEGSIESMGYGIGGYYSKKHGIKRNQKTESKDATKQSDKSQKDEYEVGATYRDANGNSAKYLGNGKWQEIK